ncbi:PREDICTED: kinesin-like protein KIN-14A isoform X2 [Nelumbo nucifera]|uniref:Kinesin-like protein KIN-14A isoform X2 n=1 Tax=Nelumbo nucifera TaxID=4432 RepID=A0A1U8BCD8_NELNU|nr:PREDICTED: kinesin-like protein KIN-14A isoform X2 [Nelumbo nucifera]
MADQRNRWNWEVPGFEPRKSFERDDHVPAPLVRRYSISTSSVLSHVDSSRNAFAAKVLKLRDKVKRAREDCLELRQEASDLQEYSNAKLDRVTRYLGVLADRARKLDQAALETEARISPLVTEKKRLFNDLLTAKGNIKVFCRTRPLFENEGLSCIEFPDDFTIRVNTTDDSLSNPKKDFEFDRVYGPHVGQGELFHDVQPFVQSALDGYNVSIFAYGQTGSGKTHTMEGSSHERGLYVRCFEELFDLSNSDMTSSSRLDFYVTIFELYNEQVHDLLSELRNNLSKVHMGPPDSFIELVQEKVENPLDFSKVLKAGLQNRGTDIMKFNVSHLIITIHMHYSNWITRENLYSKLSLVDLAGSEGLLDEDASGERVTDLLHVMNSLSALGDVLSSLTLKKDIIPYENSRLTRILADSLGGSSKTLMIVNICPNVSNLSETLSSLKFSARARNAELSLGNRDTIKKWRDVANDARKELYEKEKEIYDLKQEVLGLKQARNDANDQCVLLFNEVQKAWKVSFTLQSDLKSENIMVAEKLKIEKDQNAQLRNQVAHLLQLEQEQKMQIQQKDATVQALQAKIMSIELQLNETLRSADARSAIGSESTGVLPTTKSTGDSNDSSAVTKKLEEELSKRDVLIERLHEENEKLFDRLTEKSALGGSTKVSNPSPKELLDRQTQELGRTNNSKGPSSDVLPLPSGADKTDSAVALVKSGSEKVKSTPAGEYLTAALMDFDPEQYDSLATVADGANKLLMLETWRQHVTGGKLREITEEAKSFAVGNKSLAALFVHTPAGELQRQIRSWLAENFEFLSVTGADAIGGTAGQLELLSTAIMDGWMAGLGAAVPPSTDALGQLLSEYARRVYTSQLQHLKDIAGTLATEEAEDPAQVAKLRSALESVDHKRRKILQQMRSDVALLAVEEGGSPIQNPSTASEDARLASLISLDGILKQVKEITSQASANTLTKSKKKAMLASLDELAERMPSLLDIDHPCAKKQIADARSLVESIPEQGDHLQEAHAFQPADWGSGAETDVSQWNVLQFNTGSTTPFIIKCGSNSNSELVVKADARVQDPKGGEIIRVVPRPTVLANMSVEEMKQVFAQLPEALSLLALARTADGTRARYSRLYRTLAMKVPSLRDLVGELEKGGALKDVRS